MLLFLVTGHVADRFDRRKLLAGCYCGYALNAVDMIFIGASNQLGEFESGLTAPWLGAVPAVVLGGVGTAIVTVFWAWMSP